MRWLTSHHPDDRTLSRWMDAGAPTRGSATARHVATCDRCTRRTDGWIAIRAEARRLAADAGEAPPQLLDRILATRATVPLRQRRPIAVRTAAPAWRAPAVWLVAAAVLLVTVLWTSGAPARLDAGLARGRLTVSRGPGPQPGTRVPLVYEPIAALADAESLVVRLRVVADAVDDPGAISEQTVVLRRDGTSFRGTWDFASRGAFAVAAVELADGLVVDANGDRLFLLLAHDSAGIPTVGALFQAYTLEGRTLLPMRGPSDPADAARDSSLRALIRQHHPDTPERWAMEGAVRADGSWVVELRTFLRRTVALARLDERLEARSDLPWRTRYAMQQFARQQEEPDVANAWAARLPPRPSVDDEWTSSLDIAARRDTAAARAALARAAVIGSDALESVIRVLGPYRAPWVTGAGLLSCPEIAVAIRAFRERPIPRASPVLGLSHPEYVALEATARDRVAALAAACDRSTQGPFFANDPLRIRAARLWLRQPRPASLAWP